MKSHNPRRTSDNHEAPAARTKDAASAPAKGLGPPSGVVNTIAGGSSGGGETNTTRKKRTRVIHSIHETSFGFDHPKITFTKND